MNHYIALAEKLLSPAERDAMVDTVATDPMKGDLVEGTGGVRKLRFAKEGRGKSGSVRVIYYFYNETAPIFLLDLYGKNERANLSKAEKNTLAGLVTVLKKGIRK